MPLFFASCKFPASTVKSMSAGLDLPSSIIFLISTLLLALRILTLIPVIGLYYVSQKGELKV